MFAFCFCDCFFAFSQTEKEPGVSVMEVQGHQTVDCSLVFSPTQVRFQPNILQNSYSIIKIEQTSCSSFNGRLKTILKGAQCNTVCKVMRLCEEFIFWVLDLFFL